MTELHKLVFNTFQVNTYILADESGECVIIDPACYTDQEKSNLEAFITNKGLKPVLNLFTHCHIDHVLGMHFVREKYGIESLAHELEEKLLERGPLMGELFGFKVAKLPMPEKHINDGDHIRFGNTELLALHVPGHSQGSIAFYSKQEKLVITGDALFAGSIGRTDLPGGDYDTLISSIKEKLFSLPGETSVWPGHGERSSIEIERTSNPFFQ